MIKYLLTVVVFALAVVVYVLVEKKEPAAVPVVVIEQPAPNPIQIASTNYLCDGNQTFNATYYELPKTGTSTETISNLTGIVTLTLPAGRTVNLKQAISGSGVRYIDDTESIEFWNKGRGVTFTEKSVTPDVYTNCIEVAAETSTTTNVYHNGDVGFTLRYAPEYTVDEAYVYKALGPGKNIPGIKFTIPPSLATGTNLAANSYISIEALPLGTTTNCQAGSFLGNVSSSTDTVETNNVTYSVATSTDGAAQNRYEETVYALITNTSCLGVRYLTHYSVFENYASGTVTEFDRVNLKKSFDTIRESLILR